MFTALIRIVVVLPLVAMLIVAYLVALAVEGVGQLSQHASPESLR